MYTQPIAKGSNQSAGSPLVEIVPSSEMNASSLPPDLSLSLEWKMLLNPRQSKKGLGGQVSSLNCGSLHSSLQQCAKAERGHQVSGGTKAEGREQPWGVVWTCCFMLDLYCPRPGLRCPTSNMRKLPDLILNVPSCSNIFQLLREPRGKCCLVSEM